MTSDKDTWRNLAEGELRGKPVEDLTWHTLEGIDVQPLYTAEDLEGVDHLGGIPGQAPFTRGVKATMYAGRPWTTHGTIATSGPRAWSGLARVCLEPSCSGPPAVSPDSPPRGDLPPPHAATMHAAASSSTLRTCSTGLRTVRLRACFGLR